MISGYHGRIGIAALLVQSRNATFMAQYLETQDQLNAEKHGNAIVTVLHVRLHIFLQNENTTELLFIKLPTSGPMEIIQLAASSFCP